MWEVIMTGLGSAAIGFGLSKPESRRERKLREQDLEEEHTAKIVADEYHSGRSAFLTNTNLVLLRISIDRLATAVWICAGLLLILSGPRMAQLFAAV